MTREETIAYGESKKARIQEKLRRAGSSYGDYAIYYSEMAFTSAALAALREQEERDNRLESDAVKNEPLTLDELRQMAQRCEGVYVAHVDGSPVFRGERYCAAVLDFSLAFGSNALHVHAIYGDRLTLWEDDYGKTWLAYRSKPKEDAT